MNQKSSGPKTPKTARPAPAQTRTHTAATPPTKVSVQLPPIKPAKGIVRPPTVAP
jgi:hypothetical protein